MVSWEKGWPQKSSDTKERYKNLKLQSHQEKFLVTNFFQNISELFLTPLDVALADASVLYIKSPLSEKAHVILDATIVGAQTETF